MALNRRSPVAPVLFVLSLALAACGKPEAPADKGSPPGGPTLAQEKFVVIRLDPSAPDAKPTADVEHLKLSYKAHHVAHWVLQGDGELRISWKKENPFEGPLEEAGKHVRSKMPREKAIRTEPYPYSITVTLNGKSYTNDPDVEIQP